MKLFTFDPRTLAYTGEIQGEPLPDNPAMIAVPENATPVEPLPASEHASRHFDKVSSVWFYRPVWKAPEPTPQSQGEINAMRAQEIRDRLAAIDTASARPARSVALALASGEVADQSDVARLLDLEEEAAALRFELHSLA